MTLLRPVIRIDGIGAVNATPSSPKPSCMYVMITRSRLFTGVPGSVDTRADNRAAMRWAADSSRSHLPDSVAGLQVPASPLVLVAPWLQQLAETMTATSVDLHPFRVLQPAGAMTTVSVDLRPHRLRQPVTDPLERLRDTMPPASWQTPG
jgi:hypothetical protein